MSCLNLVPDDGEEFPQVSDEEFATWMAQPLPPDYADAKPFGGDNPDTFVRQAAEAGPNAQTLALLDVVPLDALSAAGRSLVLRQLEDLTSHVEARKADAVAAIAGPAPTTREEKLDDFSAQEVAITTRCSVYAAEAKIALARDLAGRWRITREAMRVGGISQPQARSMIEAFDHLDEPIRAELEVNMLKCSFRQSATNFRRSLTRWLAKKDPTWTSEAERARREVTVHHQPNGDGTGEVFVRGPLETTAVIDQALEVCAARSKDELGGTKDQRKLAALRDWADGVLTAAGAPTRHGLPVRVDIVLQASTFLGQDNQPAEIPGVGAIPAAAAFWTMADGAEIRCLLVEKRTGRLTAIDPTVYRVPRALAELLIMRHQTSVGPHSAVPAAGCDLEHNLPHATGGATDPINVTPLDRRWHRPKTHAGWHYVKDPATDIVTWTSPISGLTYQIHPYDYLLGP